MTDLEKAAAIIELEEFRESSVDTQGWRIRKVESALARDEGPSARYWMDCLRNAVKYGYGVYDLDD